ncbi:hypothetical protein BGP_6543 [Beggiatoa sp. PS]|nr:hypothetical protein BGP_6543 [Beggiatoa sp. PS]
MPKPNLPKPENGMRMWFLGIEPDLPGFQNLAGL